MLELLGAAAIVWATDPVNKNVAIVVDGSVVSVTNPLPVVFQ